MDKRLPLIVILGATGSGKTRLSLELAQKFKGEIIGADSMQVYKGLDLITAKATKEEQSVAPHHLIDILEPHETYTVLEYRNRALKVIDDILGRKKLPIVVGGTNYYIESLLWKILVQNPDSDVKPLTQLISHKDYELSGEELHQKLKILDPKMARRLHPNNKRKILRSLEVLYHSGRKHSDILDEQQSSFGGSKSGGGLRFGDTVILRMQCEQAVLDERLNSRVDSMVKQGLVEELLSFHQRYNDQRVQNQTSPDYTRGVFQSIGFKEFHPYLMLDTDKKNSDEGKKLLLKCIDELKMVTRRYARRQEKWTRNRFLGRTDRQVPPMYGLDTTDVNLWPQNVLNPAINIIDSYINDIESTYKPLPKEVTNSAPNATDDTFACDTCNRIFIGEFQWNVHIKSHKHKKMLERKNKNKILTS